MGNEYNGYVLHNNNNTITINTPVIEAEVEAATAVTLSSNLPLVVYADAISTQARSIPANVPKIRLSDITDNNTFPVLGVAIESGTASNIIHIVNNGIVSGFDTSGFTIGQVLFLGTLGQLVVDRPKEDFVIQMGTILFVDATNGAIKINVQEYPNPEKYYASMFQYGQATNVGITTKDIDVAIPGMQSNVANNIVFQNGNELKIIKSGDYDVLWDLSFSDANNNSFEAAIAVNGLREVSTIGERRLGAFDVGNMGGGDLLPLVKDDIITNVARNLTDGSDMVVHSSKVKITRAL